MLEEPGHVQPWEDWSGVVVPYPGMELELVRLLTVVVARAEDENVSRLEYGGNTVVGYGAVLGRDYGSIGHVPLMVGDVPVEPPLAYCCFALRWCREEVGSVFPVGCWMYPCRQL